MKDTVVKSLGTVGLVVAVKLYGDGCIKSYGDAYTPGQVEIPKEDEEAFDALVKESGAEVCGCDCFVKGESP